MIRQAWLATLVLIAAPVAADIGPLPRADIYVLGEVHDNADTHALQAGIIRRLSPHALVFEMLTPAQAAAAMMVDRTDPEALAIATQWADGGWPDFDLYAPLFAAAPEALIVGAAVPRARLMQAMQDGVVAALGDRDAQQWQVTALPAADQQAREAAQAEVHCGALPADMLPGMVAAQRLRDVDFARASAEAFDKAGGPVALITGTGHARKDGGVPSFLAAGRPDLAVIALGQFEGDTPGAGDFDIVSLSAPADRPDPCASFAN